MDTIPLNLVFCDDRLPLLAFHDDFVPCGEFGLFQPVSL